jgi:hypothetical protein
MKFGIASANTMTFTSGDGFFPGKGNMAGFASKVMPA